MGLFLAATAVRSDSVSAIAQAISKYMQSHDVKHEVLPGPTPLNDATDAQIFAPIKSWTVVLWPNYFNIHDFPAAKAIATAGSWLISAVHVYDGDYWEHLAVSGTDELHEFCSRPTYWKDEPSELERVSSFNSAPERLAQASGVPAAALTPYLVDADGIAEDARAAADDQFPLSDIWAFTHFWRRLGITYPDPPENPAAVVRLSKWFAKRLPAA